MTTPRSLDGLFRPRSVAVIGARNASSLGTRMARRLAAEVELDPPVLPEPQARGEGLAGLGREALQELAAAIRQQRTHHRLGQLQPGTR